MPVLAEQLLSMLVGFSDQLLTGWYLQEEHLAAVNSMIYVLWFLASLFMFVTLAATAMTARCVGAKDLAMARRVCGGESSPAGRVRPCGAGLGEGGTGRLPPVGAKSGCPHGDATGFGGDCRADCLTVTACPKLPWGG